MEINKLTEENISLKTQITDLKNKLNQYDNALERSKLLIEKEVNSYQKQILTLNNYIHEIYLFFNYLSINYIPSLNFSIQNDEFSLIDFDIFQNKFKIIEKYIYEINENISTNNDFNNNCILSEKRNYKKKTLKERMNDLEKTLAKDGTKYNKISKKINSINNSININGSKLRNIKKNYGINLGYGHRKKLNLYGNKNKERNKSVLTIKNSKKKKVNLNVNNSNIINKKNNNNEIRNMNNYNYNDIRIMKGNSIYNSNKYNNRQKSHTPIGTPKYCF